MLAERKRHQPRPPSAGRVVDVGGGDRPHPRADMVVDKYVADNFEREMDISLDKPLVVADGEQLPFVDDAFAYVIASHVLEHAIDPTRFAAELSRIGQAGFVQVPSDLAELTFGWPFHPWLVGLESDVLVFRPRDGLAAPRGEYFHTAYADSSLMKAWFEAHLSDWRHSIHWQGDFGVRVEGSGRAPQTADFDVERSASLLAEAGRRGRVAAIPPELRSLLRCPHCAGELDFRQDRTVCTGCGREYRVAGGVPLLIEDALLT